mgnify:CR=1 FL=1
MDKVFLDFKCHECGVEFWTESKKSNVIKTVTETCDEECPNCNKKGTVKRIPTPSRYMV